MASSSSPEINYDVFLSFRGVDTRYNIVAHLYKALVSKGIRTFKDDKGLEAGDIISDELINAIKTSWIAVAVISENYATSSWCLEELRQIMELQSEKKIKVVPIFYKVEPSDVGNQRGSFGAGFQRYKDQDKVLQWKEALFQIAELSGTHCTTRTDEADMVSNIVERISNLLQEINPAALINLENLVGMEEHKAKMTTLLDMESENEVRMVGIWGMGGIGKTTIAKVLYDLFSGQFQARCFIEDIEKIYKDSSLSKLQENFLYRILGGQHINLLSVDAGCRVIQARLTSKKVFFVLDGVDNAEQVRALAEQKSWFCPGSRIILTTRDKGLLTSCNNIYEVNCLDDENALQVFEKRAFPAGWSPSKEIKNLSKRTAQLAHGLPSALVAYTSEFSENTTIQDWEDKLEKLKEKPHKNVEEILMSSYNYLDGDEKIAFLYVACLLNGYPLSHVTSLLLDNGRLTINHLKAMSLVSISTDLCINMHALVVQTGREIVRQESTNTPFGQRCLWDSEQIYDVLAYNLGTYNIEGVTLDMCKMPGELAINLTVFKAMSRIKFLKFYQQRGDTKSKMQLISEESLNFPSSLRLFHWDALSLITFPRLRHYKNLVEVDLRYSNLERLWDRTVDLPNLRRLDVTGSENLIELPNLSTHIEELVVEGCIRLQNIPESLCRLRQLTKLNAVHCDRLRNVSVTVEVDAHDQQISLTFPDKRMQLQFEFLTNLSIEGQIKIKLYGLEGKTEHISFSSKQEFHHKYEDMEQAYIKKQSRHIGTYEYDLQSLNIKKFRYKVDFTNPFKTSSMKTLNHLTELKLVNLNLQVIPDDIKCMKILKTLDLSGNDFEYLPASMEEMSKLKYLSLQNCSNIRSLPELAQVKTLILSDCKNLESLFQPGTTDSLLEIWLDNCKIWVNNNSHQLRQFTNLTYLDLSRNDFVKVPESIRDLSSLRTLFLNNCKNLKSVEHELPVGLTHLCARGCDSLVNVSFSPDHSIKHLDLINCPRLDREKLNRIFEGQSNEDSLDTEVPCTGPVRRSINLLLTEEKNESVFSFKKILDHVGMFYRKALS